MLEVGAPPTQQEILNRPLIGGVPGANPPKGDEILLFSHVFTERWGWQPQQGWRPAPNLKSWIRPCL